jgi:hypothetical protein
VKRTDLMKKLRETAKAKGLVAVEVEGAKHTKVTIGDKTFTVPRSREINEFTAKGILKTADQAEEK